MSSRSAVTALRARKAVLVQNRAEADRILAVKRELVAKAKGPKDYMGHAADIVSYETDIQDIDAELEKIEKQLEATTIEVTDVK